MKHFISTLIIGSLLILPFASQAQRESEATFRLFITEEVVSAAAVGQVTGTRVYPVGTKDRETLWVTDAGVADALRPDFSALNLRQFSTERDRVTELEAAGPVAESWFAGEARFNFTEGEAFAWRELRAAQLPGSIEVGSTEVGSDTLANYRFIPVFSDSAGTSKKAFYSAKK